MLSAPLSDPNQHFGPSRGLEMSAKFGFANRGQGIMWAAPDGVGGNAQPVDDDRIQKLQGMEAGEAVFTLDGDFAQGKLPEVDDFTFPGPIAEAMYWDNANILGIQGPVGSGKTTTLLKSRLRRALEMPRSVLKETRHGIEGHWRLYKLLVVRETYRQLWSTTIPSYLEVYPRDMGEWSGGRGDPVRHVMVFEDANGPIEIVVEFMAFGDNVAASMRGVQTTDIWINETDTVPDDVLTVGVGRINRWPGRHHFAGYADEFSSYGQIVGDFNAPDEENWTYRVFHDDAKQREMEDLMNKQLRMAAEKDGRDPDDIKQIRIQFYNQPGYGEAGCENLANLASDYYPTQIATQKLAGRGDMLDRLVYNKITTMRVGEPVYKREFNRRVHVSDTPLDLIPSIPLRVGLDQGLKGAAVIAQFVPPFHWRFYAELHFPNERLLAKVFGNRLAELLGEPRFDGFRVEAGWGDMAGEHGSSLATDENETWNRLVGEAAGFTIRPQRIGTNRIQPRLEALRAPLEFMDGGQPGILLDPSMKFAVRGFEARYVWTDEINSSGDKRKIPDKSYTEANVMDAMQYVVLSEHRADGLSANSFPGNHPSQMGHNGGPRMPGQHRGGLQTGYDILNPYGR